MKKAAILSVLLAVTAQADDFAFKLYDRLKTANENLCVSPASIEAALAMTREGAAGNTLAQMNLLLPGTAVFPNVGKSITLESANALWIDQTFPILGKFQSTVQNKFSAEVRSADFTGQPDKEREIINRWVEKKTHDKISDLLIEGSVTPDTRLILVNAVYFKGNWLHAFEKEKTVTEPFQTLENQSVHVPMMMLKPEYFGYLENESFQCLELPYQGKEISMLVILPRAEDGLAQIEENLSSETLTGWLRMMQPEKVEVQLPRFKIESQFGNLAGILAGLGMTDAFHPLRADFSGISSDSLFISRVIQKTFIQVDETGTEAAAATAMNFRSTGFPELPKTFRANHPFLFLIRDTTSKTILFMGKVSDPTK